MGILYLWREGLSRVENRIPHGLGLDLRPLGDVVVPVESDRQKRDALLILEIESSADPEGSVIVLVLDVLAGNAVDIGEGQIGKAVVVCHAPIIGHLTAKHKKKIEKVVNPCQQRTCACRGGPHSNILATLHF